MHMLEMAFLAAVLALLVAENVQRLGPGARRACFVLGLASALLLAVLGQLRWQMAPAFLLFAVLSLLLAKRAHAHVVLRALGVLVGSLLWTFVLVLSLALPVLTLPARDGPHVVGSAPSGTGPVLEALLSRADRDRIEYYCGLPRDAP